MKFTADLLYQHLKLSYEVSITGRNLLANEISIPEFYVKDSELMPGHIYVVRSRELPQTCPDSCIFLCVGNRPASPRSGWKGMILYIEDSNTNVISIFNQVVQFFNTVFAWDMKMQELLENNADIEDYVRCSIPLFNNNITITDYSLKILASSNLVGKDGKSSIQIVNDLERVPDSIAMSFPESFAQYASLREPFSVKGQMEDPEGTNYCINLYMGNTYFGTCTLWEKLHPISGQDQILFVRFAEYIRRALSVSTDMMGTPVSTLKTIIEDLLQSFPVSRADTDWALNLIRKNLEMRREKADSWHCVVIKCATKNKILQEEYICSSIEDMLPHTTAIPFDDFIVCFCMITEGNNYEDTICDILSLYLRDMNFRCSISNGFTDLLKARQYFLQAKAILNTGLQYAPEEYIYRFSDYILPYMLRQSMGEFDMDYLISSGLKELMELDSSVDYLDTLKRYLDNECNASKTAQDLFLHRSTLLPRLEKIRSLVDLDTPQQRLYLRMCIELYEQEEARKRN